jgi:hypothetical protein
MKSPREHHSLRMKSLAKSWMQISHLFQLRLEHSEKLVVHSYDSGTEDGTAPMALPNFPEDRPQAKRAALRAVSANTPYDIIGWADKL